MAHSTILCSELISIQWRTPRGNARQEEGVLEEITAGIAVIWTDVPIPTGKRVAVNHLGGDFNGCVLESTAEGEGFLTRLVLYEKSGRIRRRNAVLAQAAVC